MISDIDDHIDARLKLIKYRRQPITVYNYLPERDHGQTIYPCIGWVRHEHTIRADSARPGCELFIPSDDEVTVEVPLPGGEVMPQSGPVSWTWKPYSTPVDVIYEIQTCATRKADNDQLFESVLQTFPPGYQPQIGNMTPLFIHDRPVNMDERDVPLYKTSFLLTVHDLWLDRLESQEHAPLLTIVLDEGVVDSIGDTDSANPDLEGHIPWTMSLMDYADLIEHITNKAINGPVVVVQRDFIQADGPSFLLFTPPAGSVLIRILVVVTDPADGSGSSITIGTPEDPSAYIGSGVVNLQHDDVYFRMPVIELGSDPSDIMVYIAAGGRSFGGTIYAEYADLE